MLPTVYSTSRRILILGALLCAGWLCLSVVVVSSVKTPFEALNNKIYDWKLKQKNPAQPNPNVIHLDVNDQAVQHFNNTYGIWPWDRSVSAKIVNKLAAFGAKAIVFDILFTIPKKDGNKGDESLFRAIENAGRVVTAFSPKKIGLDDQVLVIDRERQRADELYDRSWKIKLTQSFKPYRIVRLSNTTLPLLPIIKGAHGLGHIKGTPDKDGVYRRVPLLIRLEDRVLPSLSLAAITTFLDIGPKNIDASKKGRLVLNHSQGRIEIPTDSHFNLLINWSRTKETYGRRKQPLIVALLQDEHNDSFASIFRDKIVLVGVTWTGACDIGPSPIEETEVPLNRLHSSAIATILNKDFIHTSSGLTWLIVAAIIAAGLIYASVFWFRLRYTLILALLILSAYTTFVIIAFYVYSVEVPALQALFIFSPCIAIAIIYRSMATESERRAIRNTFGRYVSHEIAEEILRSPEGVELEGELKDVTILVCDLRNFTPMTEEYPPKTVLKVVNRFFETMTKIIFQHQGTIDEFLGDGILVIFGAPRALHDHCRNAVLCALDMQRAMPDVNKHNAADGLPELHMGIAINSGELILGNIGSEERKKYGAIGKIINIAFRTQAHAKSGEILLTQATYKRTGSDFRVENERLVSLKGISEPVRLYSVIGISD